MQPSASSTPPGADGAVDHAAFTAALTDPEITPPEGVLGPHGKSAVKRFNVYRNNVTVGLIAALGDTFPAVQRLVGEQFFNAMTRIYVQAEPPNSPLLFHYGGSFASFLQGFEPVQHLAYLPDIARLEKAWLDAYHAADEPVLSPDELAAIAPTELQDQCFRAHPAARIIRSSYAAVSIFSANRLGRTDTEINPNLPEDGLISRRQSDVEIRQLPPGAAVFFNSLFDGQTLGTAAEAAVRDSDEFDLAAAIAAMLEAGIFTGLMQQPPASEN